MEHIRSIVGEGCAQRLGGVQSHRKSSAGVMAVEKAMKDRVDIVQSTEVNEADRKLAELGYVQVGASRDTRSELSSHMFRDRLISASSVGCRAFRSLSLCPDCLQALRRLLCTHLKPEALHPQYGAGSSLGPFACVLHCQWRS